MDITPEIVRDLLDYDPGTGVFVWRLRGRQWFKSDSYRRSWNTKYAGKRAGGVWINPKTGYQCRHISLLDRLHKEHHLAWMWKTDDPLPPQIDHEDRDGTNNRWRNLRASDNAKNGRNRSMSRNNTSGITGVCWDKREGKWVANCRVDGELCHLGYFDELDEAGMEVMEFRIEHGFDPGHGLEVAHYLA